ncbi:MAG: S-layer homology domain-containing protein, partial [Patescibacteria group bacterium]
YTSTDESATFNGEGGSQFLTDTSVEYVGTESATIEISASAQEDPDQNCLDDVSFVLQSSDPELSPDPDLDPEITPDDDDESLSGEEEEETPEVIVDEEEEEEEVAEEETEDEDVVTVLDQDCIDPFVDTEGHWAEIKVCELYVQDVVDGKFTNLYVPNDYMTRAEFLKVLLGAAGFDEGDAGGLTESYTDVSSSDWYYSWIAMAENEGILRNQGGAYRPNEPITRADAAVLTVRLAGLTLYGYTASDIAYFDVKTTDYFAYAVILASDEVVMVEGEGEQSVIEGYSDGSFRPYSYMTRAEVATMLLRAQLAWF